MSSATIRTKLKLILENKNPAPFNPPQTEGPETLLTGINEIDRLTGGIPRGSITEIFGPASSGCTSLLLSIFSQITEKEEFCCLIDPSNAFDPASAAATGVDLAKLLWVRTGPKIDPVLKTTDLLLKGGGFGLIGVDLGDIPSRDILRIPYSTWFRLQRATKNTSTILLFLGQTSSIKTCASLVVQLEFRGAVWSPQLLHGVHLCAKIVRSRMNPSSGGRGQKQLYHLESPDFRRVVGNTSYPIISTPPQGIGVRGASHHER